MKTFILHFKNIYFFMKILIKLFIILLFFSKLLNGQVNADSKHDFYTSNINSTFDIITPEVITNDTIYDKSKFAVDSFIIDNTSYNISDSANLVEGNFSLSADGSFIFVPSSGSTGNIDEKTYPITNRESSNSARLFSHVQNSSNLLEFMSYSSCNQGYSFDGNYKIRYDFSFINKSAVLNNDPSNFINSIQLTKDFNAAYGNGCVISIDDLTIETSNVLDFNGNPYPRNFNQNSANSGFLDGSSNNLFSTASVNNAVLYPRQSVSVSFCVSVDPFCNGRPNPTPSGSGIDFETNLNLTSSSGNDDISLLLTDFHTTETFITAAFDVPEAEPEENPDGTYDFINTVTITNDGNAVANNVNYNMGLGSFLDNGLSFDTLTISQISGPPVSVNTNYDGDSSTNLLESNVSLAPGDTVVLEIFHLLAPVSNTNFYPFYQISPSQTQGILDDFDEDTPQNRKRHSFVTWEDVLGSHVDRYYSPNVVADEDIDNQCSCETSGMRFSFLPEATSEKNIVNVNESPSGILENEELTFEISFTNTSDVVNLENLQLQENFNTICGRNPISFTTPQIIFSSATTDPTLNTNFDGVTDINIFDGNSGLLKTNETITLEVSIVLAEDCIGENTVYFTGKDPVGNIADTTSIVAVNALTDTDNDGIPNNIDIDDDNDTILDIEESNGLDPLGDHDSDLIPNYRDTDFGADTNNDGIVDSFDFDGDGTPNHLDLDSDNDGIFDIFEVGNADVDTSGNGQTNNPVGFNGLDNTVETDDTENADITYVIPNNDNDPNPNYLDIDADADGIVDNIEAQPTDNYISPNNIYTDFGIDTAYASGLTPVDTDGDSIPDYIDINSDNDIRDDNIEGWDFDSDGDPETTASDVDFDNDGLDDAYDNDITKVNPTNGLLPTDFPNADYDVTFERDWREIMAVVVIINDVSAVEGDDLQFTISLVTYKDNSIPVQSQTPIEITLFTTDGTDTTDVYNVAISPFDYNGETNNQIVIPPLSDTFQFTITSLEDNISELDELFTLNADITSNNTINIVATGIGIIIDNDPPPTITMNNDIVFEGEDLVYNIILSNPSSTPIEINIMSADDTAISPDDYRSTSIIAFIDGTEDPANPNLTTSFSITTFLDNLNEPDEEILDVLGNVISNNIGIEDLTKTGTILDIDPDPLLVITDDTVVEGNTLAFTITLLNEDNQPMRNYLPINFNLETVDITTSANRDYLYFFESTFIPALDTSYTQDIPTLDDNLNEKTETMNLVATITSSGISNLTSVIKGLGTIKDNDIPNLFSPNNDGQSDVFRIDGLKDFPNFKLVIFDRWGGEIYNYNNNGKLRPSWWDGTRNGKPVIEGVYFYKLDFNDGKTKPKTGFIQLIR